MSVTGYKVHYQCAGDRSAMVPANSTSVEISDLTITETYLFSVQVSTNLPDIIVLESEERSLQLS